MTRSDSTAEERQDQLVTAAVTAFAQPAATPAPPPIRSPGWPGVSQPYVIRLFGTKQQLFLAAVRHAVRTGIEQTLPGRGRRAEPTLASLGAAYDELLAERELITVLLHGFAASARPGHRHPSCATASAGIYALIRELTGATRARPATSSPIGHAAHRARRDAGPRPGRGAGGPGAGGPDEHLRHARQRTTYTRVRARRV